MKSTLQTVKQILFYLFLTIRAFLHVYWIRVNRFLFESWAVVPGGLRRHILVIGDEFALGYGDWITLGKVPGVTRSMESELAKNNKIRQRWRVFNRGVPGSNSSQWLPPSDSKTKSNSQLFSKLFSQPKYKSVDIVIIIVGFNDLSAGISPQETAHNIKDITESLAKAGHKLVLVCTIPTYGLPVPELPKQLKGEVTREKIGELRRQNEERNTHVMNFLSKAQDKKVIAGLQIDVSNFEYKNPRLYWSDNAHFNAKGYKKLAEDIVDCIVDCCVKIEFSAFSEKLGYSPISPTPKEISK